jgi:hypothetical protein
VSTTSDLDMLKAFAQRGYTIQIDPDGTERVMRPDGSVAVIARPKSLTSADRKE